MAVRQYTVSAVVDQKRLQASAKVALASQTIKIPVNVKAEGITDLKVANTTMTKLTDSVGNTRVEIDKFNSSGQKLGTTIKNSSKEVNTLGSTVKNAGKKVTTLGQDFLNTLGKVTKFGAVTAIIGAFTTAITESIKTVKDFDDALTDFKKVSDLSGESLTEYTEKLGTLGETVARTRKYFISCEDIQ